MDKQLFSWFEDRKLINTFSKKNKPDVILTDNDSLALALKYDNTTMSAPIILIKGKSSYAQKIINAGKKNNITIIEKPELVNELYLNTEVNQSISYKYFEEVAVIFAKVFKDTEETDNSKKEQSNFEELLTAQRKKEYDLFSLIIPEKIQLELNENLYVLLKDQIFTAATLGLQAKNIKVNENKSLSNDEYLIKLNGTVIKKAEIKYISDPYRQVCMHLNDVITKYSKELIGRDDIVLFISQIKERNPVLIEETMKYFSVGEIRKILCSLLEEKISVQNITTIFETIADFGEKQHDLMLIEENIRIAIGRDICFDYLCDNNTLKGIGFSPEFESIINENIIQVSNVKCLKHSFYILFLQKVLEAIEKAEELKIKPVFICRSNIRKTVFHTLKNIDVQLAVISEHEVPKDFTIEYVLELEAPDK